jgi:hypothetical protein
MAMVPKEKFDSGRKRSASFQPALAIKPHQPQSTAPYIREGRWVIDWHSLAVARTSAIVTGRIINQALMRRTGTRVVRADGSKSEDM